MLPALSCLTATGPAFGSEGSLSTRKTWPKPPCARWTDCLRSSCAGSWKGRRNMPLGELRPMGLGEPHGEGGALSAKGPRCDISGEPSLETS
eukprot:scaffold12889_cov58-Phaeocystis_antarctica.AAC.2